MKSSRPKISSSISSRIGWVGSFRVFSQTNPEVASKRRRKFHRKDVVVSMKMEFRISTHLNKQEQKEGKTVSFLLIRFSCSIPKLIEIMSRFMDGQTYYDTPANLADAVAQQGLSLSHSILDSSSGVSMGIDSSMIVKGQHLYQAYSYKRIGGMKCLWELFKMGVKGMFCSCFAIAGKLVAGVASSGNPFAMIAGAVGGNKLGKKIWKIIAKCINKYQEKKRLTYN